ncbi:glycosyltransferase family 39 protein [bacterium]|nr:glycosyltransferase family 39 protein [bacterium]
MNRLLSKHRHLPVICLLLIVTLIRLFFIVKLNLGDDEAYFWECGQHFDWSYLDHPPMAALISWLFTFILGNNEVGVRLGPLLFSSLFLFLIYRLTYQLFNNYRVSFYSTLLLSIMPIFSVGGIMLAPDAFLSFFWTLAIVLFYTIIKTGKATYWYLLGIVWGLGMLSKYNMGVLPISIGLFLILSPKNRFWFLRIEIWIGLLIGALVFSPVIIWNTLRGFPSLAFHLVERNASFSFSIEPLLIYLVGQLTYLSPLVFILCMASLIYLIKKAFKEKDETSLFIVSMSLPYLLVFSIACSLSPTAKPHWPAMGYIPLFCAIPWLWEKEWKFEQWWKKIFKPLPVLLTAFAITFVFLTQTLYPIMEIDPELDMTNELYGWPEAGERIQKEYDRLSKEAPTIVFTKRYNVASQVSFYTPGNIPAYSITGYSEQQDLWERGSLDKLPKGAYGIYVANTRYKPGNLNDFNFASFKELPPVIVKRGGKIVRKIYIIIYTDYLGKKAS